MSRVRSLNMLPIQSSDRFLSLSVVRHLHECKPGRQPGVAIHDDMNLHYLSVGFEQSRSSSCVTSEPRFPTKRFFTTFPLSVAL